MKQKIEPRRVKLPPILEIDEDGVPVADVPSWGRPRWSSDEDAPSFELGEWSGDFDD